MGRWLAVAVVLVTAGTADAAPKKKVLIQSTPSGASVYVGSVEDGEKCKTPCSIDVESESIVIVDLAGHKPKSEAIVIKKTEKAPYKRSYKLVKSVGTLKVDGPSGASVFIDNADTGKIPFEEDVAAGSHVVTVKVDGKEVYSAAVEVPEDEDFKINVPAKAVAKKDPDEEDTDPKTDTTPGVIKKATPKAPRAGNLFGISSAFSVGFRDFTYKNVDPMTTRTDLGPENEGGQILAGVFAEVWPGNILGVRFLRGLAVVGRAQVGVNSQEVIKDNDQSNLGATTFWRSFEGSLRQRWVIASAAAFEVSAGYVRDIHSFSGNNVRNVPSADYQSLKIGGRASILLGQLEPYLAVENRVVMSGGQLGDRFVGANATGVRGALGIDMRFGHISGKLEGSLTRYSWTFNNDPMNDAEGATDSIKQVGLFVGYTY